jgi:hypothetical protein
MELEGMELGFLNSKKTQMSVASNSSGTVAKDGAFSQLFGTRINSLHGVTTGTAVFKTLDVESATIASATANSINGSAINIVLSKTNPNELLATNAAMEFVSIPYGLTSVANSVPQRATSGSFTQFSQLALTDTTNQITASQSPNLVVVNAVAPALARVYSFQLEGPSGSSSIVATSTSGVAGFGFLDDNVHLTQMAIKSSTGPTFIIVNSAAGFNSLLTTRSNLGDLWSIGNFDVDDSFQFNWVFAANSDYMKFDVVSGVATLKGHLLPQILGVSLGTATKRLNAINLVTGANSLTNTVTFTPIALAPNGMQTISVLNTRVTANTAIVCAIEDFNGVVPTNGIPYAIIDNIVNGGFDLNLYNASTTNTILLVFSIVVRYWILPETS